MAYRIDCILNDIGKKMQNVNYSTFKHLPVKLNTHISSGYYADIYGATTKNIHNNTNNIRSISKSVPDYVEIVLKFMNDMKYNIRDIGYMKLVQKILLANISPSFPIMYSNFKINNFRFIGINGDGVVKLSNIGNKITEGKALGIMMEYLGNTTLENYIFYKPERKELKIILFQTYHAIYALIKYGKINHNDFHFKNVMLYKLKKPETMFYIFDDKTYKVICQRYLPIIIDINGNLYKQKTKPMKDIKYLNKQLVKLAPEIMNSLKINTKTTSLKKFFDENFDEFLVKEQNMVDFEHVYKFI